MGLAWRGDAYVSNALRNKYTLGAGQRSPLLEDRVGMRLGLEVGYPVMGGVWCMNYYEPVMVLSIRVSHTSGGQCDAF